MKSSNPKDAIASNKVPLSLLSPVAKALWAVAQAAGMLKYGAWNWRKAGVRASVYLDAMDRHRDAYLSGEELDPVDGTPHLANIMACCAILLDAKAAGKLTDDRPPSVGIRETYAFVEGRVGGLRKQYEDKNPKHYTIADTEHPLTLTLDCDECGADPCIAFGDAYYDEEEPTIPIRRAEPETLPYIQLESEDLDEDETEAGSPGMWWLR